MRDVPYDAMSRFYTRRVHVSWHIAAACVGVLLGVIGSQFSGDWFGSISWLLTGLAMMLAACTNARATMIIVAVTGGMFVGLWRGSTVMADISHYDAYIGSTVRLSGTVAEDSDVNERGQLVLRLRDITLDGRGLQGAVWLTIDNLGAIRRSDLVEVSGTLSEGFGSFVGSMYDADLLRVSRARHGDIALDVRDWFSAGVSKAISEPESSLGLGYLVGQRRGLSEDLDNALQAAGLTHIVVASGYNLTILVRLARRLFENISKYASFISSMGMVAGFVAVTGLSPSMSRAGLVAGLSLVAWYYGRRFHPLVLLPLAMAITVIIQPSYVWGDLGWQLSFAAFGGVMILAPLLNAYFFGDIEGSQLRRIFLETMAATIATLPIIIAAFGQFSVVAPLANMAVLPLVPLAMVLTFIAGIAGLVLPDAASIVGFPAETLLGYMVRMAEFMGGLPWALQDMELQLPLVALAYICLVGACIYIKRVTGYDLRTSSLIE